MPTTYHLSPCVFSCLTGRYCIFLDLKRDLYFSVPGKPMAELGPWIEGWQPGHGPKPLMTTEPSESASALALELLACGALREGPMAARNLARIAPEPDCDLASISRPDEGHEGILRWCMPVTLALLHAEWMLHAVPIARIVETVRQSKPARPADDSAEYERAAHLTMLFQKYRPYFPRNYLCLFDSLALIGFLARFRVYPDWVFGVQDDPFSAHCWVQAGNRVLNDELDHVSSYAHIMTV